jgi:hypothetical protein
MRNYIINGVPVDGLFKFSDSMILRDQFIFTCHLPSGFQIWHKVIPIPYFLLSSSVDAVILRLLSHAGEASCRNKATELLFNTL